MLKYEKRNQILDQGRLVGKINFKPFSAFLIIGVFAVLLFMIRTVISMITGSLLLFLGICGLLFIKDRPIVEVYPSSLILYNEKNSDEAVLIPLSEISKWETSRTSSFSVDIYTNIPENPMISFDCFSTGKVISLFKEVMPQKQSVQIGAEFRRSKHKQF